MFPDIIGLEIFVKHLHDLIRKCVSRTEDDIRFFGLHIFGVYRKKLLICICINIFAACQSHKTSHVGIFGSNDVAARKPHQDQHLRMVFSLVLLFVFFVEIPELFYQRACLLFPVKNLSQFLNGTVHPLYTAKI